MGSNGAPEGYPHSIQAQHLQAIKARNRENINQNLSILSASELKHIQEKSALYCSIGIKNYADEVNYYLLQIRLLAVRNIRNSQTF